MLRRLPFAAALLALLALAAPPVAAAAAASDADGSEDAIVVISGDVTVGPDQVVEGVYVASGDVDIEGRVNGDVVVFSGDAMVSGTIEGDLFTASGRAHLRPSAEVTGDVNYGDERPLVSGEARVRGDVQKEGWPDLGGLLPWIGGFLVWLAITISTLVLGGLLLLIAPRAADALQARTRERIGPVIAIGIAILLVLPIGAFVAAITILGLPLAILVGLALLPLGAVGYVTTAYVLGRAILKPPRERLLAFLVGLVILRACALVPLLGLLVGLAAVIFGLGLIGTAIGAARDPEETAAAARSPGS